MHTIRVNREFEMLKTNPPPGITVWPTQEGYMDNLTAELLGPQGTPYEKGSFKLQIVLGEKYPIEPPQITFQTKIYHPNIDESGRICLASLKQIPKSGWMPIMTLYSVLSQLLLLLQSPNPDDPLVVEIKHDYFYWIFWILMRSLCGYVIYADQYLNNRPEYESTARLYTLKYAASGNSIGTQSGDHSIKDD